MMAIFIFSSSLKARIMLSALKFKAKYIKSAKPKEVNKAYFRVFSIQNHHLSHGFY